MIQIQIHAGNYVGLWKYIKTSRRGDIFIKLSYFITFSCYLQEDFKKIERQIDIRRTVAPHQKIVILSEARSAKSKNLRTIDAFYQIIGAKILRLRFAPLRMTDLLDCTIN